MWTGWSINSTMHWGISISRFVCTSTKSFLIIDKPSSMLHCAPFSTRPPGRKSEDDGILLCVSKPDKMGGVGNGEANQFSRTLWIMQGVVVLSSMHGRGEYICCRFHYLRYPHCSFQKLVLALFINSLFVTTISV